MKRVLVTCFEPFGKNAVNTSKEAVDRINCVDGVELSKLLVPVAWWKSVQIIEDKIKEINPDVIIMCGLASGSDAIRVELRGENVCGKILDNDKVFASTDGEECEIIKGGEQYNYSTFNSNEILNSINSINVPVRFSESAGKYICNHILYSMVAKYGKEKRVGFIHVPDAKEFGGNIALDDISKALINTIINA